MCVCVCVVYLAGENCAICMCSIELHQVLKRLPCFHTFHHLCCYQWLLLVCIELRLLFDVSICMFYKQTVRLLHSIEIRVLHQSHIGLFRERKLNFRHAVIEKCQSLRILQITLVNYTVLGRWYQSKTHMQLQTRNNALLYGDMHLTDIDRKHYAYAYAVCIYRL